MSLFSNPNWRTETAIGRDNMAKVAAVKSQWGSYSWYNDYIAAATAGAQPLANWMNQRANTYSDWNADAAAFASTALAGLQDFEDGGDGFLGIKETQPFIDKVAPIAGAIAPYFIAAVGGYAVAGAAAGATTIEAGAAGETAVATGIDASTGLYAGESAYAGTATYGTVGGSATGAALPSASWLDSLIDKGTSYIKNKAESTIMQMLRGGSKPASNAGAPPLSSKQNTLPRGNLGAIYGSGSGGFPYFLPAEGEFGSGVGGSAYSNMNGSTSSGMNPTWIIAAIFGFVALMIFGALLRR